jgi:DNA adenine methylase
VKQLELPTVKIPLRRYGGKVYLAKWIISHFPEHTTYVEPFCGSGAVFFAKEPAQAEILNDIDGRIINAFEQMRSRPFELAAMLWATPYAQKNWRQAPATCDLERAALDIAATVQYYAGATHTSTFSIDAGHANKNKARVWADWFQRILPAAARLKDAQILCEDALAVIARFADLPHALFYVDPPYRGHEGEYADSVCFRDLAACLFAVKGKVIVSGTTAEKDFFPTWRVVGRQYVGRARVGRHKTMKSKTYEECLYLNFDPPAAGTAEPPR